MIVQTVLKKYKKILVASNFMTFVLVTTITASPLLVTNTESEVQIPVAKVVVNTSSKEELSNWEGTDVKRGIIGDKSIIQFKATPTAQSEEGNAIAIHYKKDIKIDRYYTVLAIGFYKLTPSPLLFLTVKIKDKKGVYWTYDTPFIIENQRTAIELNLDPEYFSSTAQGDLQSHSIDLSLISEVQFQLASLEKMRSTYYGFDNILLKGGRAAFNASGRLEAAVSPKRVDSNDLLSATSFESGPITSIDPIVSSNIQLITVDGKKVEHLDRVNKQPRIQVEMRHAIHGITTWNIEIINARTHESVAIKQGNEQGSQLEIVKEFRPIQPLLPGSYKVSVNATNSNQETNQVSTPEFVIESSFQVSNLLNGPNPFNPNNTETSIQYQLSDDADISLYIYSISGEKIWDYYINKGDINGARAGFNKISWNGKNTHGEIVANGPYILYLIANNGHQTKTAKHKMLVLK